MSVAATRAPEKKGGGRTFTAPRHETPAVFEEFARHFEELFCLVHAGGLCLESLAVALSGVDDDLGLLRRVLGWSVVRCGFREGEVVGGRTACCCCCYRPPEFEGLAGQGRRGSLFAPISGRGWLLDIECAWSAASILLHLFI